MNVKNSAKISVFVSEESTLGKTCRISLIPKSIEFKANCFSPEKNLIKQIVSNEPNSFNEKKSKESNKNPLHTCQTATNTTISKNKINLTEILEDNEEEGINSGLINNIHSDIMHKSFFNKSIMDFNKAKNQNKTFIFTEPGSHSMPDVLSQYRCNSENFLNIEEKYSVFENYHEFHKKISVSEKEKKVDSKKSFHPTFKLDFNNKLPPTDEKVGLTSRLYGNFEEDLKLLKKMREETVLKKKQEKKKFTSNFKEKINQDLEIYQLHENFEKNLELFKKEEDEFLRKIKKFNLLEEDSFGDTGNHEKSKLEKDFEESLFHIVLEEKTFSKDFDNKKTLKEPSKDSPSKLYDSKISKMTIDSKISNQKSLSYCLNNTKKNQNRFEDLMKAILNLEIEKIDDLLEEISIQEINKIDANGNSPLLLAVKMAHKNEEFQNVIKNILKAGGNPKMKDSNGWTPLDESITQTNVKITLYLFDFLCQQKKLEIENEKNKLLEILQQIPDFYLEMKWEFESSIIPLISHIAPSDTFKIWKYGKSIRVDYNLVGVKNLKAKKRDISIIFNPSNDVLNRDDVKEFNSDEMVNMLWLVNNSHQTFTNPLQEIDIHEKKMILYDLLTSQPIEGNMNILECQCHESKNWLGNKVFQRINNWKSKRFDLSISYEYKINKKEHIIINGMDDYLKSTTKKSTDKNEKCLDDQDSLRKIEANDQNFIQKLEKMNFHVPIDKRKKIKKTNMVLWISEEFPMKFKNFLPILSFLSKGSNVLNRLSAVLNNKEIKNILNSNGFPVKIQIPFSFSIVANVFFQTFKFLDKNDEKNKNLFEISKNLKYCDRKIAQKIMTRPKKRILLANLLI